ncbi:facilitated trehalose transporter Tret1-2 homolog [Procambarus clarkii]|uniref:facilitated trehalose transporter Tret1-2 homolog n=1 Tax=Procambarus clarkii TaxID=6728 RepID=UPI001E676188|nr:facilitated trehalose transporter Tret1-2 homolog [Procambarus clarkii]XP_045613416.1 facilitated trehalose transporter Tret1-2 homolog [Procambarus clarkii]
MALKSWFIYRWRQICASCVVVCAVLCTGMVVGWSVEVSRIMEDPNTNFNLTINDQEWLVSCAGVMAIFSTAASGMLVEAVGPCRLLGFVLLPATIGWILMAATDSLPWIYVGRVVTGGVGFMVTTVAQPLLAEMCTADVRGLLSSLPEMMVSVGMLLVYVMARFLDWQNTTLVCGLLIFPVSVAVLFVPESPYWLLKKGKEKIALRALMQLRAPEHDVDAELSTIRDSLVQQAQHGSFLQQFRSLKEPGNYRPVVLVTVIFILRELGGAMVIFMYSVFFFVNAGVSIDPFTCSVLVGICRLLFTLISASIIDRLGRRPLLITSSIICGLALFVTGGVLYSDDQGVGWVPLTAVMVYVASFGLGAGPVPWILLGELLPTPVRSLGASIVTSIFVMSLFLVTQVFPELTVVMGLRNAVLVFGAFEILLALVVFLFLPETRGRTLEELQNAFVGSSALTPFSHASREGYAPAYGSTFPSSSQIMEKVR